jgi:tetratricopeptide (TPR) repeat protein
MPDRASRWLRRPWLTLAIPLALAVAATWRVLPGEFQFDDQSAVVENLAVKDLGRFLAGPLWRDFLDGQRPVTTLTFALNYAYGRLEPWNYHVTNLLLHLVAVVLAWAVGRAILRLAGAARADALAVVAAGLFALHPLQSQAVSYVAQRAEVLASCCFLAGLACLLAADRRGLGWRGAPWWVGAALAFLVGLGAKAIVVTLPAAWLLVMALAPSPAARPALLPWRLRLAAVAPALAGLAAWAASALGALKGAEQGFAIPGLPPWRYLLSQLGVVTTYLRLLAWPAGQSVDWHLTPPGSPLEAPVLAAGLFLAALAGGALTLALRARQGVGPDGAAARVAGTGVLWFFLVLSTTSSVVPLADLLMEHRVYLPSLGLFLAVAVAAERLLARAPAGAARRAGPALVAAAWLGCAALLHARNAVWETRRALWADAVEKAPRNPRAWNNLAAAALDEGRWAEAVEVLRLGLPRVSGDAAVIARMHANLGGALMHLGRHREAERTLAEAAAIFPWDAVLSEYRALNLIALGRLEEAEAVARRLTAGHAPQPAALAVLGRLALARGDAAGALALLDEAIALDPDPAAPYLHRALAMGRLGRRGEACLHLRLVGARRDPALAAELGQVWGDLGCGATRPAGP